MRSPRRRPVSPGLCLAFVLGALAAGCGAGALNPGVDSGADRQGALDQSADHSRADVADVADVAAGDVTGSDLAADMASDDVAADLAPPADAATDVPADAPPDSSADGPPDTGPPSCPSGFGDCSGVPGRCETDLSRPETCGGCSRRCSGTTPACVREDDRFVCGIVCPASTPDYCSGMCVDLQTRADRCGSCRNSCLSLPNIRVAACQAGKCVIDCNAGWGDCTTQPGCESRLDTQDNCGACGNAKTCTLANVEAPCIVDAPACTDPTCKPGFANCDRTSRDCEAAWGSAQATCAPKYLGTAAFVPDRGDPASAMAPDGSLFIGGSFRGSVDLDPTAGVDMRTSAALPNGQASVDGFVTKLNPDGSYAWTRTVAGSDYDAVASLAVAADGSVVAGGSYAGTIDFDPGPGVASGALPPYGAPFVLKLGSDGAFVWVRTFDATTGTASGAASRLALDQAGAVYVAGQFSAGGMDFDPGAAVVERTSSSEGSYLVKLTSAGAFGWVTTLTGESCFSGSGGLAVSEAGTVWHAFGFRGACAFDGGGTTFEPSTNLNGVVVKLAPTGSRLATWVLRSEGYSWASVVAPSKDGNVYIGGEFSGTVDFDFGAGTTRRAATTNAGFMLKVAEDGTFRWVQQFRGRPIAGAAATSDGGVVLAGTESIVTGTGGLSSAVWKLDADQTSAWSFHLGGSLTSTATVTVGAAGFVVTGRSETAADFDPGPAVDDVPPASFVSRFGF
jgi:hypothetical protein